VPDAIPSALATAGPRLAGSGAVLKPEIEMDVEIPQALFDSFVENGIDNGRQKIREAPQVALAVEFTCTPHRVELRVCDTGSPIDAAIARRLFREPIVRGASLGIGLYQSARQASHAGYRVELTHNDPGHVCIALVREANLAEP